MRKPEEGRLTKKARLMGTEHVRIPDQENEQLVRKSDSQEKMENWLKSRILDSEEIEACFDGEKRSEDLPEEICNNRSKLVDFPYGTALHNTKNVRSCPQQCLASGSLDGIQFENLEVTRNSRANTPVNAESSGPQPSLSSFDLGSSSNIQSAAEKFYPSSTEHGYFRSGSSGSDENVTSSGPHHFPHSRQTESNNEPSEDQIPSIDEANKCTREEGAQDISGNDGKEVLQVRAKEMLEEWPKMLQK